MVVNNVRITKGIIKYKNRPRPRSNTRARAHTVVQESQLAWRQILITHTMAIIIILIINLHYAASNKRRPVKNLFAALAARFAPLPMALTPAPMVLPTALPALFKALPVLCVMCCAVCVHSLCRTSLCRCAFSQDDNLVFV